MYIQGSENEAFYGVLAFYVSLRLEKYQNSDITFKNQILKLRIVTAKKKKSENSNSFELEFYIYIIYIIYYNIYILYIYIFSCK